VGEGTPHPEPVITPEGLSPRLAGIYQRSLDCVHCGLCLSACPTYRETGREISSPRGRIYLMRGHAEGAVPLEGLLSEEAYLCLGCRACETACPSGVQFGAMVEAMRAEVEAGRKQRGPARRLERFLLRHVLPDRTRLGLAVAGLGALQTLRLPQLARPLLPARLKALVDGMPWVPPRRERERPAIHYPAEGEPRGRVALFEGCVAAELYARVNRATARVLARNGFEVVVPALQTCCGALHAHAGDPEWAARLVRENLRAFADVEIDAVVVNSAGCGAAIKEWGEWVPGDADAFARSTFDVLELLDRHGLRAPSRELPARVCYDAPCHLVHGQGIRDAPRRLLRQVRGLELVTHHDPEACCGAAGSYSLTHPAMSRAVLERKLDALAAVDPDWIATANPGCLMQLEAGVRQRGLRARVLHPVEILDAAYDG